MELKFSEKTVSCLQRLKTEVQTVEQTQELRMPEEMPDIGSVLNAWGQVLLRGKQWHDGYMSVSGGVMVWILYLPDSDDQTPQTAQAWIPFQTKFDLPEVKHDGAIWVSPLLQTVDARSISARKMVARVNVSVHAQAYLSDSFCIYNADDIPEDVHLYRETYPMRIPMEIGEKEFTFDEELQLPSSAPSVSTLVNVSLIPELLDKKVLSGKMVYRGIGRLHVLYMNEENRLHTWDFEIPFSQYAQLDADYEQSAEADVLPVLTAMELEIDTPDKLRLKAAITGQYMIYDVQMIEIVSDAYSTLRSVEMEKKELELPAILEQKSKSIHVTYSLQHAADELIDIAFYPDHPMIHQSMDDCKVELNGVFHVLYRDNRNTLCATTGRWSEQKVVSAEQSTKLEVFLRPCACATGNKNGSDIQLQTECFLESTAYSASRIPMISGLQLGQIQQLDADRPCLVIRRKGNASLWDLAKRYGSTVTAIEEANGMIDDTEDGAMLLIPIA